MNDNFPFMVLAIVAAGIVIAVASCAPQCGPAVAPPAPAPACSTFEYKIQYALPKDRPDRKGEKAIEAASVTPATEDLTALGKDGWDLASTYLEPETAFAQFSKDSATPNVRPQRLVMIFKKPACH